MLLFKSGQKSETDVNKSAEYRDKMYLQLKKRIDYV